MEINDDLRQNIVIFARQITQTFGYRKSSFFLRPVSAGGPISTILTAGKQEKIILIAVWETFKHEFI